jgi:hypothetical protein
MMAASAKADIPAASLRVYASRSMGPIVKGDAAIIFGLLGRNGVVFGIGGFGS